MVESDRIWFTNQIHTYPLIFQNDPVTLPLVICTSIFAIIVSFWCLEAEDYIHITDLKRGEELLRESNQKLRLLTGLTRHDILNQINALQVLLNMADTASDPVTIRRTISRARRAGDLIEAPIGFTREYENLGTSPGEWQHLSQMIEHAQRQVTPDAVLVENQIPENLEMYADPIMRKVFVTLPDNSLRYGGFITKIRFSFTVHETSFIIPCEDTGIGIPDNHNERIFEHGYGVNSEQGLFPAAEILSVTGFIIKETGTCGTGAKFEIHVPEGKFRFKTEEQE